MDIYFSIPNGDTHCLYISPNIAFEEYRRRVDEVMTEVRNNNREVIVVENINSKSPMWNSPVSDKRGECWVEWAASLNLIPLNNGNMPTFQRGRSKSYIDVTFTTTRVAKQMHKWKVIDVENLTFHRYIQFEMAVSTLKRNTMEKWKTVFDWEVFTSALSIHVNFIEDNLKLLHWKITEAIAQAYRARTHVVSNERRTPYWWNSEINAARLKCTKTRRKLTRCRRRNKADANE